MPTKSSGLLQIFLAICRIYTLFQYMFLEVIITENHYYSGFGDQLSFNSIEDMLTKQSEWIWLGYVLAPIFLILKFIAISICILTGAFLFAIKINFRKILSVVLIGEFVLIFGILITRK